MSKILKVGEFHYQSATCPLVAAMNNDTAYVVGVALCDRIEIKGQGVPSFAFKTDVGAARGEHVLTALNDFAATFAFGLHDIIGSGGTTARTLCVAFRSAKEGQHLMQRVDKLLDFSWLLQA